MGVMTEQFSSMEHDAFLVPHLSDTIPEAVFHGQAVKTVAYLRVSTPQQDVRSQRLAILEYARAHDFRIDDFIEATASGQASEKRRRLDELTSVLQRGDRLGRSLGQIVTILDALAKARRAPLFVSDYARQGGCTGRTQAFASPSPPQYSTSGARTAGGGLTGCPRSQHPSPPA